MTQLSRHPTKSIAALSHLLLRILCLSIVEYDCARLVQQSSGMNAVAGNYVLAALYGIGLLLALLNKKTGYVIGMLAGSINIIAKVMIVVQGHEHFPFYPFVWIPQSAMVVYFCYVAYRELKMESGVSGEAVGLFNSASRS